MGKRQDLFTNTAPRQRETTTRNEGEDKDSKVSIQTSERSSFQLREGEDRYASNRKEWE